MQSATNKYDDEDSRLSHLRSDDDAFDSWEQYDDEPVAPQTVEPEPEIKTSYDEYATLMADDHTSVIVSAETPIAKSQTQIEQEAALAAAKAQQLLFLHEQFVKDSQACDEYCAYNPTYFKTELEGLSLEDQVRKFNKMILAKSKAEREAKAEEERKAREAALEIESKEAEKIQAAKRAAYGAKKRMEVECNSYAVRGHTSSRLNCRQIVDPVQQKKQQAASKAIKEQRKAEEKARQAAVNKRLQAAEAKLVEEERARKALARKDMMPVIEDEEPVIVPVIVKAPVEEDEQPEMPIIPLGAVCNFVKPIEEVKAEQSEQDAWKVVGGAAAKKKLEDKLKGKGRKFVLKALPAPVEEKKIAKTRMCNTIVKGTTCNFGSKCTFAHNLDELTLNPCQYGESCRCVALENGKSINRKNRFGGGNVCEFIHPFENREMYFVRVGLKKPEPIQAPVKIAITPVVPKPVVIVPPPPVTSCWKVMWPKNGEVKVQLPKPVSLLKQEIWNPKIEQVKKQEEPQEKPKKIQMCKAIAKGMTCRFGEDCRFPHDVESLEILQRTTSKITFGAFVQQDVKPIKQSSDDEWTIVKRRR